MNREKLKTETLTPPTQLVPPDQLVLTRAQTARALGLSTSSIIRLETEGQLTPIKLSRKPTAMTFYKRTQVRALAEGRSRGNRRKVSKRETQ